MSTRTVTFPFPGAGTLFFAFPGSMEGPDGCFLASGRIERLVVRSDTAAVLTVELFDAHDAVGAAIGSTNRAKYEIDVTGLSGLMGSTPNRFECQGTAVVNVTLGNHNRKFDVKIPANAESQSIEVGAEFPHGMIVRVTPSADPAAATTVTVTYAPTELGAVRRKAKTRNWGSPL